MSARSQNVEEDAVKELLLKGENLQKRAPDQDKREQIRLKHNQLNSKYNAVKVRDTNYSCGLLTDTKRKHRNLDIKGP